MNGRKRAPKNTKTFTPLMLERLRPPQKGQELIWDEAERGLSLLVSPGGTKSFRSMYRLNGKWLTRTLGRFGDKDAEGNLIDIHWARGKVQEDRRLAEQGIDPNPKNRSEPEKPNEQEQSGPALYEGVVDQFIEHYAKPRQRTWKQTERALKINCKTWLGRPIDTITAKDARDLLRGLIATGRGPTAALTLAWLRTLWRWAYREEIVPLPMMDRVTIEFEKRTRERVYSDDEIKAIWRAAEKLDLYRGAFIKLLVLLAPRKTALAHARWSHLNDPDNPTLWTTPNELTKTKKKAKPRTYLTPLPPLAQRILKSLTIREDAPTLLFPGRKKGEPLDPGTPLSRKLASMGAPDDFNFHAMRHTVATWLQKHGNKGEDGKAQGYSPFEIGLILNHAASGVTANYLHSYQIELKKKLLNEWADHVENLIAAEGVSLLR